MRCPGHPGSRGRDDTAGGQKSCVHAACPITSETDHQQPHKGRRSRCARCRSQHGEGYVSARLLLRVIHRGGSPRRRERECKQSKKTQNCPGKRRTCERAMEREQNHSTKGPPCFCASLAELVLLMQHELRLLHTRVPSAPTKLVAACYMFALVCMHNTTLDGLRRRNFASCGRDGRKGRGH